jgi:hypothetical protein
MIFDSCSFFNTPLNPLSRGEFAQTPPLERVFGGGLLGKLFDHESLMLIILSIGKRGIGKGFKKF